MTSTDTEIRRIDANGSIVACGYDSNDRVIRKDIEVGPGVSDDSTFEDYKYDGLGRLAFGGDNDSTVARLFDSHSNVLVDEQNGTIVASTYDGVGNQVELHYPSGRIVFTSFDELERKDMISDGDGMIAMYSYIGPFRVESRKNGNGTQSEFEYNGLTGTPNTAGDFGVKRMVRSHHYRISDGMKIDDRAYKWDRVGNKIQWSGELAGGKSTIYNLDYDSAYRLVLSVASTPNTGESSMTAYTLDGVGNRKQVTGGNGEGNYGLASANSGPSGFLVNQYTSSPDRDYSYDLNGNAILAGTQARGYDFSNRLTSVSDGLDVWHSKYDIFGRRFSRGDDRFAYFGVSVISEKLASRGSNEAEYVVGAVIDEHVQRLESGVAFYYYQSQNRSVVAITSNDGAVIERPSWTSFGDADVTSVIGNEYAFQGRRLDSFSGLYFYRARFYDPAIGRFVSRDPIGGWADATNKGNALSAFANNPPTWIDPLGLEAYLCGSVHVDICVTHPETGKIVCYGFFPTSMMCAVVGSMTPWGDGVVHQQVWKNVEEECDPISSCGCFTRCAYELMLMEKQDPPVYRAFSNNCRHWAKNIIKTCDTVCEDQCVDGCDADPQP